MSNFNPESIPVSLMHGIESSVEFFPCMVSEKLDGIRAVYIPGEGFFTRTGKRWAPDMTAHIKVPATVDYWLDGEFYTKDLNRQEISEAMAVGRKRPTAATLKIQYNIFDGIIPGMTAWNRYRTLRAGLLYGAGFKLLDQYLPHDRATYEIILATFRGEKAEGVMLKSSTSLYTPGRSGNLVKKKFWKTESFVIVDVVEGIGKLKGNCGALKFNRFGVGFEVGTMNLNYTNRAILWTLKQNYIGTAIAVVRYLTLSRDGIPQNTSVERIYFP